MEQTTSHIGMRTGLFVGSFDPFTIGHASVVRRALPLFDRLVIGVGINPDKQYFQTQQERCNAITRRYADEPRISAVAYDDMAVDLARRVGAQYIVKGIRNAEDLRYEQQQADYNRRAAGIETIFLTAEPHLINVSSTAERAKMTRQQTENSSDKQA